MQTHNAGASLASSLGVLSETRRTRVRLWRQRERVFDRFLAVIMRLHPVAAPVEQDGADIFLKHSGLSRERWLNDVEERRCAGDVIGLSNGQERF